MSYACYNDEKTISYINNPSIFYTPFICLNLTFYFMPSVFSRLPESPKSRVTRWLDNGNNRPSTSLDLRPINHSTPQRKAVPAAEVDENPFSVSDYMVSFVVDV